MDIKRKLLDHQKKAIEYIWKNRNKGCIFLNPGTGKTTIAIRSLKTPCLVICRRDDYYTWERELKENGYSEKEILCVKDGKFEWDTESLPSYLICTYDLIKSPTIGKQIKDSEFSAVVADEAHYLRHNSGRTKAVVQYTRAIPGRLALTATPAGNDLSDVFRVFWFIYGGEVFGDNYWAFRRKYYSKYGYNWVLKPGSLEKIKQLINRYAYNKQPNMNLPVARSSIIAMPLEGDQKVLYEQVDKYWELPESSNGNSKRYLNWVLQVICKLREIATGFYYSEDFRPVWCKNNKIDFLVRKLKEDSFFRSKNKIVIWAYHNAEIEKLRELLPKEETAVLSGLHAERVESRKKFQKDPKCKYFVGQVEQGVGMNELVVSNVAIYVSNSLRFIARQQSEGRIRRKGSEELHKSIHYFDIITERTVNEVEIDAMQAGMDLINYVTLRVQKRVESL